MNLIYIMIPFFNIQNKENIQSQTRKQLHFDNKNSSQKFKVHEISYNKFAVQLEDFCLHFLQINRIIQEHNYIKNKVNMLESVIKEYELDSTTNEQLAGQNVDVLMKKVKKYKQIKEENKKLKKLLHVQLQNTQKVRQETQKTMKVLREQFDALVSEIGKKDKNNSNPSTFQNNLNLSQNQARQTMKKEEKSGQNGKHVAIR